MTVFDYIVLAVLASSVALGLARGLVKEVVSLASWVVAYFAANAYSAKLAAMLPHAIPGETARVIVAFVLLFIGVRLLMGLLGQAAAALLGAAGLGLADRALGAAFGLGRAVVIVLAVVTVCGMTSIPQQAFWRDAQLRPAVEGTARAVKPYLPAALARHVRY